ncbi:serine hydrolase domain-containing protein [Yinghuangia seranimata]|uniref:serine hydrolase domain-containing protein n=1 Tax=Yinghuangia seranimata TaxID=408067 RepID=UPI00248B8EF9|nr:serine hydrolase domain-containing protein [Yinghuangia seranimata]MDI2127069.1 serine hydrolase domain-containing protein [Yinghuangia seranimata]
MVVFTAAAITAAALTGPARAAGGHQATRQAMDAAVQAGVPGVTAEARDADGVWKAASGVGDLRTGAPRGTDDRFRVGNLTDTFVATVLLQMEAERRLSLDDTVERRLPGVVRGSGNDGRAVTVRQLLNHTSGLFDYLADPGYAETYVTGDGFLEHRYDTLTPEARVQVALSHAPLFAPGARHSFSNTNDVLAAMVVEKVSGRSYEAEVRDRILKPLGLKATSTPKDRVRLPHPSGRGYAKLFPSAPDRIDDVTEMNASQGWGNGDIVSSAEDLNRFYGALMRGQLLPPRQLAEMKTTVANPDFPGASYGLGIEHFTMPCGAALWYHDGGVQGSITVAATTDDGRHRLAFNYNGSWGAETLFPLLNAEFCAPPSP